MEERGGITSDIDMYGSNICIEAADREMSGEEEGAVYSVYDLRKVYDNMFREEL